MKVKLFVPIFAALFLVACSKVATQPGTIIGEFKVDRLFTVDGCTVYRFSDAGYYRYFTNCRGNVSSSYTVQSGKTSTVHTEEISTEVQ